MEIVRVNSNNCVIFNLIAGAGKTVLTSILQNELVLPRRQDTRVTYYYFDFREEGSQTSEALLESTLNHSIGHNALSHTPSVNF